MYDTAGKLKYPEMKLGDQARTCGNGGGVIHRPSYQYLLNHRRSTTPQPLPSTTLAPTVHARSSSRLFTASRSDAPTVSPLTSLIIDNDTDGDDDDEIETSTASSPLGEHRHHHDAVSSAQKPLLPTSSTRDAAAATKIVFGAACLSTGLAALDRVSFSVLAVPIAHQYSMQLSEMGMLQNAMLIGYVFGQVSW